MRLPRDLSCEQVVQLLRLRYDYQLRRNRGSHMTVTVTTAATGEHSVTVPRHRPVRER